MNIPELRRYQIDVIAEFHFRVESGCRRIMLAAPTGSGKTIISAEIIREKARARRPVLVLAHRREIITQTSQKLHDLGIAHGIIQAGFPARRWRTCKSRRFRHCTGVRFMPSRWICRRPTFWLSTRRTIARPIPIRKSSKAIQMLSY